MENVAISTKLRCRWLAASWHQKTIDRHEECRKVVAAIRTGRRPLEPTDRLFGSIVVTTYLPAVMDWDKYWFLIFRGNCRIFDGWKRKGEFQWELHDRSPSGSLFLVPYEGSRVPRRVGILGVKGKRAVRRHDAILRCVILLVILHYVVVEFVNFVHDVHDTHNAPLLMRRMGKCSVCSYQ